MSETPLVCGIILTADRPQFIQTAIRCFHRQTYQNKRLFVYDTGHEAAIVSSGIAFEWVQDNALTIGQLRNCAITAAKQRGRIDADIIMQFDDDEWSAPTRMAEQVEFLQKSGAQAVGYREMLFWREPREAHAFSDDYPGEAWIYDGAILGTSLCYWRSVWESKPFPATSHGEDLRWQIGLRKCGSRSLGPSGSRLESDQPRMIARIHPGNTSDAYRPAVMAANEKQGGEWRRVPQWDEHCREVFARERTLDAR